MLLRRGGQTLPALHGKQQTSRGILVDA